MKRTRDLYAIPFPKSFPDGAEESFLGLVVCDDASFPARFAAWKQATVFDDIDYATVRLLPLICIRMKRLGMTDDPLFGRIKGVYKSAWVWNQRIFGVLRQILAELEARNIPVLVLKGIPLLLDAYHDMGARFLGDADVVIPPEHAEEVVAMMRERGWHFQRPWMPDVNNPVASMYRVTKSSEFENDQGVSIDIHWNIFGIYHHARVIDLLLLRKSVPSIAFRDAFWKSAVALGAPELPARRLCGEDVLIHIIIHGSEDNVHRTLRWVTDAAAIIRSLAIDWSFVLARAREFGLAVELFAGLRYLRERMGLPVPESFLDELSRVPVSRREIREFFRRSAVIGGERFSPLNNLLMFWYAYLRYEPKRGLLSKTPFGFLRYVAVSLGMNRPGVFPYIMKKYLRKVRRGL